MISKKKLLKAWKIYAVLDDDHFPDRRDLFRKFLALVTSPVDAVQLRFKDISDPFLYDLARRISDIGRAKKLPVIINDRPDMALALGCSGVHLGKGDIPAGLARKMLGGKAIIGRTVRDIKDIRSLNGKDVDYVSIGPVYRTPLKPSLKTVSRSCLREVCEKSPLPVVAIGGINSGNARELAGCGVKTVAFIRYGITEKNTRGKIEKLRKIMDTTSGSL